MGESLQIIFYYYHYIILELLLPMVFLNKHHSIKITELVEFIIKHVGKVLNLPSI